MRQWFDRCKKPLRLILVVLTTSVAVHNCYATRLYPWALLPPDDFLRRLEIIGRHGELRDVEFVENTLGMIFQVREQWLHIDDRPVLASFIYEPKGDYDDGSFSVFYIHTTGLFPTFAFGQRPLLSSLRFRLQEQLCVKWVNMAKVFENKYSRLNI